MTDLQYKYGTSGFRFHHAVLEKIAVKIGNVVGLLSGYYHVPYGIMITASHNPHEDNGVKIVNADGEMINAAEEKIITDYVNGNYPCPFEVSMQIPEVYVGYDTRKSSPKISNLIISGILELHQDSIIHNMSVVTTPELHYAMYAQSKQTGTYIDHLHRIVEHLRQPDIICDCANGVGTNVLIKLQSKVERMELINTNTENYLLLNEKSGSDYVVNHQRIPYEVEELNRLHASLDGDADRVVFYYQENEDKFHLLNGDKISALIAFYVATVMKDVSNVAVIHTGYSNKAFLEFIHSLGIRTVCTATGVKNLHEEALKYDISIYFESNGHGTVLFNKSYPELHELQDFFHPTIGDGIMDMFAVLFILQEMKLNAEDWKNFYLEYPYSLFKMEVTNKDEFLTTKNELRLTAPETLQNYIDAICEEGTRAFVRPSGTENYLRVYVESGSEEMVEHVKVQLSEYIKRNHVHASFEKNGTSFEVCNLSKNDYDSNYFHLLKQLTEIDPNNMDFETFCRFVEDLNEKHIIKLIKMKDSKKIVGSITVLIEEKLIHNFGKVAHIEDVVVDESMRGFGLGKKLLEIAESECDGCYKIILNCSNENVKFYEKCGYEWKGNEMARYT